MGVVSGIEGTLDVSIVGGGGGGGGGATTIAASGVAAGAFVAGALLDGADLTQGTKADAAYAGSGPASLVALLKGMYAAITSTGTINPPVGYGTQVVSSVTVGTSATQIVAARTGAPGTGRGLGTYLNSSTQTIFTGPTSAVTTATGFPVAPGGVISGEPYTGALYGIVASGTAVMNVKEVF